MDGPLFYDAINELCDVYFIKNDALFERHSACDIIEITFS